MVKTELKMSNYRRDRWGNLADFNIFYVDFAKALYAGLALEGFSAKEIARALRAYEARFINNERIEIKEENDWLIIDELEALLEYYKCEYLSVVNDTDNLVDWVSDDYVGELIYRALEEFIRIFGKDE